jgi:hypothetical protein
MAYQVAEFEMEFDGLLQRGRQWHMDKDGFPHESGPTATLFHILGKCLAILPLAALEPGEFEGAGRLHVPLLDFFRDQLVVLFLGLGLVGKLFRLGLPSRSDLAENDCEALPLQFDFPELAGFPVAKLESPGSGQGLGHLGDGGRRNR